MPNHVRTSGEHFTFCSPRTKQHPAPDSWPSDSRICVCVCCITSQYSMNGREQNNVEYSVVNRKVTAERWATSHLNSHTVYATELCGHRMAAQLFGPLDMMPMNTQALFSAHTRTLRRTLMCVRTHMHATTHTHIRSIRTVRTTYVCVCVYGARTSRAVRTLLSALRVRVRVQKTATACHPKLR